MKRLLVVEDEKDISEMIVYHLSSAGYKVETAYDADQACAVIDEAAFDLVVLDVLLPGMTGWELCRKIRADASKASLPIIFVSALSSEADRIRGFDLGCDDYLMKPFSPREMVSRVRAILRRAENRTRERTRFGFGPVTIDFLHHRVTLHGKTVHFTQSEFQLLYILTNEANRVFSREELLTLMRENDSELELGNIDVHVHRVRQKIELDPEKPRYIQTVWGVGYRFVND